MVSGQHGSTISTSLLPTSLSSASTPPLEHHSTIISLDSKIEMSSTVMMVVSASSAPITTDPTANMVISTFTITHSTLISPVSTVIKTQNKTSNSTTTLNLIPTKASQSNSKMQTVNSTLEITNSTEKPSITEISTKIQRNSSTIPTTTTTTKTVTTITTEMPLNTTKIADNRTELNIAFFHPISREADDIYCVETAIYLAVQYVNSNMSILPKHKIVYQGYDLDNNVSNLL